MFVSLWGKLIIQWRYFVENFGLACMCIDLLISTQVLVTSFFWSVTEEPMGLVAERSPSDSGQSGCLRLLAHWLVLSFFARSDRPLSFVPAQVTGETTYTRRTARSRAPFAEDTQFRRKGDGYLIERLFSERWECSLGRGETDRDRNIGRARDRFERKIRDAIYAYGGQDCSLPANCLFVLKSRKFPNFLI